MVEAFLFGDVPNGICCIDGGVGELNFLLRVRAISRIQDDHQNKIAVSEILQK